MHMNATTLDYEERVTEASILPTRHTELEVELPSSYPWVGRAPTEPEESVSVAVEVKHHGGEFEEVTRVGPLTEPTVCRLQMPRAPEEQDAANFISTGQRRSAFRLRLIHVGRHEPRCRMRIHGL